MISAVTLTKNEEKNIKECLETLDWCDEVVVVDDNSDDRTCDIAKKLGARVFSHSLNGNFALQRNFGIEKTKGDWILFVDADERVSGELRNEIGKVIAKSGNQAGYNIKRVDVWKGREIRHGEAGSTRLLRLAKKDAGEWKRKVHEVWDVQGFIGNLKNPLYHYPHSTLSEFIAEIDKYTTLDAEEKYRSGVRSNLINIIFWPIFKFKLNYIFRLGFLDGTQGFLYAALMSFHSFLSWSKLWLMQRDAKL